MGRPRKQKPDQLPFIDYSGLNSDERTRVISELKAENACLHCQLRFASHNDLEAHKKRRDCIHICSKCNQIFRSNELRIEHEEGCKYNLPEGLALVYSMQNDPDYFMALLGLPASILNHRTQELKKRVIKVLEELTQDIFIKNCENNKKNIGKNNKKAGKIHTPFLCETKLNAKQELYYKYMSWLSDNLDALISENPERLGPIYDLDKEIENKFNLKVSVSNSVPTFTTTTNIPENNRSNETSQGNETPESNNETPESNNETPQSNETQKNVNLVIEKRELSDLIKSQTSNLSSELAINLADEVKILDEEKKIIYKKDPEKEEKKKQKSTEDREERILEDEKVAEDEKLTKDAEDDIFKEDDEIKRMVSERRVIEDKEISEKIRSEVQSDTIQDLFKLFQGKDYRSPSEVKELESKEAYNAFYDKYLTMARESSINKKLDRLGPCTPEQIYTFIKREITEQCLHRLSQKIGQKDTVYEEIYRTYLSMKTNLPRVKDQNEKKEMVRTIIRLQKDLERMRLRHQIYADDVRDEQRNFIGIKDGDLLTMIENLNDGNVLAALNDLCAIGMASDLCEAVMNILIRLYFDKRDKSCIPFRLRDQKRMKIEFQRPDRSWTTDLGGTRLGKIICLNICKTLLISSVIFPEIMIREEREIEKNNLMNHFDLTYVQRNLTLLHDKRFQLRVVKRLVNHLNHMDLNNDESKDKQLREGIYEMRN